jgi:hypothetical protein
MIARYNLPSPRVMLALFIIPALIGMLMSIPLPAEAGGDGESYIPTSDTSESEVEESEPEVEESEPEVEESEPEVEESEPADDLTCKNYETVEAARAGGLTCDADELGGEGGAPGVQDSAPGVGGTPDEDSGADGDGGQSATIPVPDRIDAGGGYCAVNTC